MNIFYIAVILIGMIALFAWMSGMLPASLTAFGKREGTSMAQLSDAVTYDKTSDKFIVDYSWQFYYDDLTDHAENFLDIDQSEINTHGKICLSIGGSTTVDNQKVTASYIKQNYQLEENKYIIIDRQFAGSEDKKFTTQVVKCEDRPDAKTAVCEPYIVYCFDMKDIGLGAYEDARIELHVEYSKGTAATTTTQVSPATTTTIAPTEAGFFRPDVGKILDRIKTIGLFQSILRWFGFTASITGNSPDSVELGQNYVSSISLEADKQPDTDTSDGNREWYYIGYKIEDPDGSTIKEDLKPIDTKLGTVDIEFKASETGDYVIAVGIFSVKQEKVGSQVVTNDPETIAQKSMVVNAFDPFEQPSTETVKKKTIPLLDNIIDAILSFIRNLRK
jgi:hypothetical protein